MKKISSIITNFLLYLGVIVLIGAFIFAMIVNRQNHNFIFDVLPFFVAISGIFVLIFGFVYTKKAYHIFTGLMLFTWGIIIFLIMKEYIKRDLYQLWPLIGITTGIFLYISGMYKYKKVKFGYFIPALSLFLLSTWFLLFSLKIIKVSFQVVALVGGPLFVFMACILIVGFFLLQKKYTHLVVNDDDCCEFDDDELGLDKNGE